VARQRGWLQSSTSALVGHVLTGVAPTLAAATEEAEREVEGTVPASLHLYGALVRGDMVIGGTRAANSAQRPCNCMPTSRRRYPERRSY
jgi:hypothetical protein